MLGATLPCDSGAAMVQTYHPVRDKSTHHAATCGGTFVRRRLVQMHHGALRHRD